MKSGWYRISSGTGVQSALQKAVLVPNGPNKIVDILVEQRYEFTPVYVLTDTELKKVIDVAIALALMEEGIYE